jgi:hypothetical protein
VACKEQIMHLKSRSGRVSSPNACHPNLHFWALAAVQQLQRGVRSRQRCVPAASRDVWVETTNQVCSKTTIVFDGFAT